MIIPEAKKQKSSKKVPCDLGSSLEIQGSLNENDGKGMPGLALLGFSRKSPKFDMVAECQI